MGVHGSYMRKSDAMLRVCMDFAWGRGHRAISAHGSCMGSWTFCILHQVHGVDYSHGSHSLSLSTSASPLHFSPGFPSDSPPLPPPRLRRPPRCAATRCRISPSWTRTCTSVCRRTRTETSTCRCSRPCCVHQSRCEQNGGRDPCLRHSEGLAQGWEGQPGFVIFRSASLIRAGVGRGAKTMIHPAEKQ